MSSIRLKITFSHVFGTCRQSVLSKNNYVEPIIISELDPKQKSILSELENLDVDSLRPIDALMLLNKWKKEIDE